MIVRWTGIGDVKCVALPLYSGTVLGSYYVYSSSMNGSLIIMD